MSDPWPAIKMLAGEILTKLSNLSYLLFLSCTVITAHWPALSFLCKQRLILLKDRGASSSSLLCPSFSKRSTFSLHSQLYLQLKNADHNIWETPHGPLCCPVSRLMGSL